MSPIGSNPDYHTNIYYRQFALASKEFQFFCNILIHSFDYWEGRIYENI
jgi:hypothetical protein